MAIVSCPECGKQVSDRASACPNCGCPIAQAAASNVVKIAVAQHPNVLGCVVPIKDTSGRLLVNAFSGSAVEIKTSKPISIQLCGTFGSPMLTVTVKPGKKYKAVWGVGLFSPRITSCHEVDIIDA